MADETRIETGHVGLNVSDLARSKAFYEAALELATIGESQDAERRYAFLGAGKRLLLTLWEQSAGSFDAAKPGLHHLSFHVPEVADVERAESRLRVLGAKIHHDGIVAHAEGASSGGLFFEDPDGIRLEIFTTKGVESHAAPSGTAPTCGFF